MYHSVLSGAVTFIQWLSGNLCRSFTPTLLNWSMEMYLWGNKEIVSDRRE